jgi:predicted RNase H-like nuclease (RuvC/YqgF family)
MTTTEERDIVWLPRSLATKVNYVTDAEALNREILNYVEETKKDLRINIESMEEDIILYRAQMIKARDSFKQAKEEQLDANYKLWEEYDVEIGKLRVKVSKFAEELKPLKQELDEIKKQMDSINKWGLEDLIKTIKLLNETNYGETEKILKFLFENYKKV